MSSFQSARGILGYSSPARPQDGNPQPSPSDATASTSGRKRSNTRHRVPPPAIHLSLKPPSSAPRSPATVDLNQEDIRTPRNGDIGARSADAQSGGGYSSRSEHSSRRTGLSPSYQSKYGTYTTSSPLTESPGSFTSSSEILSSSLPPMLSPLTVDTNLDLDLPSPISSRLSAREKPTSSPYLTSHGMSSLHPSPASRAASAPGSRKSSAASLDREAILHLDMKRLLSKPALPSHSGSSIISVPSDHDMPNGSPSSRHPHNLANPSTKRSQPANTRRMESGHMTDGGASTTSQLRTLREAASRVSLPAAAHEAEQKSTHKVRNVLKRRPSARSNPATPTATTFRAAEEQLSMPHSVKTSTPKRAASATATPVSVARIRKPEAPPAGLTPAGAVAHAYKQQERRREELAEASGSNEQAREESSIRAGHASVTLASKDDDEEAGGAYYSVFGSTSGRLVAVGSAGDSTWDLNLDHEERLRASGKTSSGPVAGVRTLTRKVSGKFKKAAGGIKRDQENSPNGAPRTSESVKEGWAPFDGRPSMSVKPRSMGASLDEYVDVLTQASTGSSIPSVPNGRSEAKRDKEPRTLRAMRSFKGRDREPEKLQDGESSPGGKLWKLVKRISTGGLRDKYVQESEPPPVPALPKNYQNIAPSRLTLDIRKPSGRESPAEMSISRFMQSRTSMSVVRPSSAPGKGSPRTEHTSSRPSTARPSTTTRSSSPMSSDMASSRFFNKTHSAHSSISSYGAELPPLPQHVVGHHIMPPSDLYKLNHECAENPPEKKRVRTRSHSAVTHAPSRHGEQPPPSLPPPRRATTGGKNGETPSPTIPSFSNHTPVNDFSVASRLSLPMSEFGILSDANTPPRPRRSSRRKPVPSELTSPSSTVSSPMPRTPSTPTITSSVSLDYTRSSMVSHSSGRSTIQSASLSHSRSPLRFREIESPRSRLTEQEKAAKWDDLLERSDRAGGTLHLGETGLMSDSCRLSEYSEASST